MKPIFVLLALGLFLHSAAQQTPPRLPSSLVHFFTGTWKGAGTFANGKPIAATATFTLSLDSCWLQYEHVDIPPNVYKAHALWGAGNDGSLLAYIFDNFGGHRQFTGNYTNDALVLVSAQIYPGNKKVYQQFVYRKLSAASFKMSYEMSTDSVQWRMGDTLIFHRAG
ncbi:MAG: hypothetical protein J7623_03290 [Chitinophaga sp.]|uniref:hypothetical protein n=1 Tax=Chitinophaga sp. TaxID=1869181 RepID=UPI001B0D0E0F|nr:hypothetical protein [Chitinophaga sp.]MBO9727644.1 hypothetical protein [Chitinophaga sp.]